MHLEVPLLSQVPRRAKSDYGAFNCRKHLRSAAGGKEGRNGGLCHVCYGLLPTFPLLSSDDDDKGGRGRETLNVNLTNNWSGRHEKTFGDQSHMTSAEGGEGGSL